MKKVQIILSMWVLYEIHHPFGNKALQTFDTQKECIKSLDEREFQENNPLPGETSTPQSYICSQDNLENYE